MGKKEYSDDEILKIFNNGFRDGKRHKSSSKETKDNFDNLSGKVSKIESAFIKIEVLLERLVSDFEKVMNIENRVIKLETKFEDMEKSSDKFEKEANKVHDKMRDEMKSNGMRIAGVASVVPIIISIVLFLLK